jgi:hypothetical protein
VKSAAQDNPLVEYVRRSLALDDPAEVERRADTLSGIGYEQTADHLRERAAELRVGEADVGRALNYSSPLPEASDEQWAAFVRQMQKGDTGDVTPSGQVGVFKIRMKRLEDLGLAKNVRRVSFHGGTTWTADFKPPLTMQRLLADPLLQYRIFVASMKRYRSDILSRHRDALGREIEGKPATLSGLLAVAHHAGPALDSWLRSESDRKRFERTTAAYGRLTGGF